MSERRERTLCRRYVGVGVLILCLLPYGASRAQTAALGAANLHQLYALALENDNRFRASKERYEAAALRPEISRSRLLPQIKLTADRRRLTDQKIRGNIFRSGNAGETDFSDYNVESHAISVTQTLFRRDYYIELNQSKSEAERALLELEAARQELMIRLAEAYFGVLSAQTNREFADARKDTVKRQFDHAQQRLRLGLGDITDSKKAQTAYELAVADALAAENTLRIRKLALELIVKRDITSIAPLAEQIPTLKPSPENPESWVSVALEKNLALLAQKITAAIAADEIKQQQSGYFPSIGLYATHSERDVKGGPSPNTSRGNEIGVELEVPIFSGGDTYYRSRQAVHDYNSALEELEQTHRETEQNMRETYLNVITDISRIAAFARAQEAAQVSYESNVAGFEVGKRSSVDVLLAIEELFEAKNNYADTRHEYILDTLRMKRASGQLAETDIQRINEWLR